MPVDAGSTVGDVAYILNDSNPSGIWTSAKLRPVVEEAMRISGTSLPVRLIDDYELTTPEGEKASIRRSDEETALIIYTSGTTGNPKGVMLSFANLYANIRAVSEDVPIFAPHRRTMILLPLHHVLPLLGSMIAPILIGAGVAICPSMSGPDIMDTLCRGKVGIIIGVPRLWQTLYQGIKKKIDAHLATRLLFAQNIAATSTQDGNSLIELLFIEQDTDVFIFGLCFRALYIRCILFLITNMSVMVRE